MQEIVFTPAFVQVGSVVILPLSHLWPVAATSSVFVAVQPEFVHLNVLTPFAVQVGAVVTVPLSHLWPVAGIVDLFPTSVQPSCSQYAPRTPGSVQVGD